MIELKKFYSSNITQKYLNWLKDEEIVKFTAIDPKIKKKKVFEYVKKHQNSNNQKLLRIFYLNKHVGNIRINFLNSSEVTIGIIIGEKDQHNLGIGSKALKKLIKVLKKKKIKSIIAYVSKKNIKSIFFFKKNGFYLVKNKKYFIKLKKSTYHIFKFII